MPASSSSSSTAEHRVAEHRVAEYPHTRWVSAHLYYQGELDDLLRRAVRPLVGELAACGLIDGFFFIRYWQGGPHLRLRLLLRDQEQTRPVERSSG